MPKLKPKRVIAIYKQKVDIMSLLLKILSL